MFDLFNPDSAFDRKLEELEKLNAQLDAEIEQTLSEHQVTGEQLTTLLSNEHSFNKKNWEFLIEERKRLEKKLEHELALIRKKKKPHDSKVQQHWIFAR